MKEINIRIDNGDTEQIANTLSHLSGVMGVHSDKNNITACCGNRMSGAALMNIINEMQRGDGFGRSQQPNDRR